MKDWLADINEKNFFYVSGVVLANASLDIAFHDTVLILGLSIPIFSLFVMIKTGFDMPNSSLSDNNWSYNDLAPPPPSGRSFAIAFGSEVSRAS